MPEITEDQLRRLPIWAQHRIAKLEADEAWWKAKATAGPEDSDTFVWRYDDNQPLGREPTIRFQTGAHYSDYIEVRKREGRVEIMAGEPIVVSPHASNLVFVEIAPDRPARLARAQVRTDPVDTGS